MRIGFVCRLDLFADRFGLDRVCLQTDLFADWTGCRNLELLGVLSLGFGNYNLTGICFVDNKQSLVLLNK